MWMVLFRWFLGWGLSPISEGNYMYVILVYKLPHVNAYLCDQIPQWMLRESMYWGSQIWLRGILSATKLSLLKEDGMCETQLLKNYCKLMKFATGFLRVKPKFS